MHFADGAATCQYGLRRAWPAQRGRPRRANRIISEMPRRLTRTIRRAGSHAGESSHQAPETESKLTTLTGSSRTRGPYGETIGRLGPVADQTPSVRVVAAGGT